MRRLTLPVVDDFAVLDELAKSRASSAIAIRAQDPIIRDQYASYTAAHGDPWSVVANAGLAGFREHFEKLYDAPPVALKHVKNLREGLSGACPMCGRDALGTLDHYLPQSNYPEFCFFSRNLIPACSRCNTARGNSVQGGMPGQRALHPYFDTFADNRVMTVEVIPDWRAPEIRPVAYGLNGPALEIVQWQIDNVIIPSGFLEYVAPIWGIIVDNPVEILGEIPNDQAIVAKLAELERIEAITTRSKNSWKSCLYHGIGRNPGAVGFLVQLVQEATQTI